MKSTKSQGLKVLSTNADLKNWSSFGSIRLKTPPIKSCMYGDVLKIEDRKECLSRITYPRDFLFQFFTLLRKGSNLARTNEQVGRNGTMENWSSGLGTLIWPRSRSHSSIRLISSFPAAAGPLKGRYDNSFISSSTFSRLPGEASWSLNRDTIPIITSPRGARGWAIPFI